MPTFRDLPVELCEEILLALARSYRAQEKQPLLPLLRVSRSVAGFIRPALYDTVYVSPVNIPAIVDCLRRNPDAFRTTKRVWLSTTFLTPQENMFFAPGFSHVVACAGTLRTMTILAATCDFRPCTVIITYSETAGNLASVEYNWLSHVKHLYVKHSALAHGPDRTVLDLRVQSVVDRTALHLRVQSVVLDFGPSPSLEVMLSAARRFLDLRTLRALVLYVHPTTDDWAARRFAELAVLHDARVWMYRMPRHVEVEVGRYVDHNIVDWALDPEAWIRGDRVCWL